MNFLGKGMSPTPSLEYQSLSSLWSQSSSAWTKRTECLMFTVPVCLYFIGCICEETTQGTLICILIIALESFTERSGMLI